MSDKRYRDETWLREQYVGRERSTHDIADELGCTHPTVLNWLEKYGIETRDRSPPTPDERLESAKWLREQYKTRTRTANEIGAELGCNKKTVLRWIKRHGIETREEGARPGPDNPSWAGGETSYGRGWTEEKRQRVRERDDERCQDCGISQEDHREQYGVRLHVHHLIKARDIDDAEKRNAMSNLITLCRDCHPKWERLSKANIRPEIERSGVSDI